MRGDACGDVWVAYVGVCVDAVGMWIHAGLCEMPTPGTLSSDASTRTFFLLRANRSPQAHLHLSPRAQYAELRNDLQTPRRAAAELAAPPGLLFL